MERIDGDSRNCAGCDFKIPNRGQEMHEMLGKIELHWRLQGEQKVGELKTELERRSDV